MCYNTISYADKSTMECFRSVLERNKGRFGANKKILLWQEYNKEISLPNFLCGRIIETQGRGIKATSQTADLKLSTPVSRDIPQVRPLAYWNKLYITPQVSYRFFRSCCCCTELLFDWPLETVQRRSVWKWRADDGKWTEKGTIDFLMIWVPELEELSRLIDSEIMRAFNQHALLEDSFTLICFY